MDFHGFGLDFGGEWMGGKCLLLHPCLVRVSIKYYWYKTVQVPILTGVIIVHSLSPL